MDSPKCKICGKSTEWHGWLKGWLCTECDAPQLEVMEAEDEEVKLQQYEDRKCC